jgi:hypothetical protein
VGGKRGEAFACEPERNRAAVAPKWASEPESSADGRERLSRKSADRGNSTDRAGTAESERRRDGRERLPQKCGDSGKSADAAAMGERGRSADWREMVRERCEDGPKSADGVGMADPLARIERTGGAERERTAEWDAVGHAVAEQTAMSF